MAVSWLSALAARGSVPVYPAVGPAMADQVRRLALEPDLELVSTPRLASVLLVAGVVPSSADVALRRVHAQLPRPCGTLWYRSRPFPELDHPQVVDAPELIPGALRELHRVVLHSPRDQEPMLLPDAPPAPFEGRGDHGQGGEGMMGGMPYGRPMAMTADDLRDGLALDAIDFTLGPFFRGLPPGLVLELRVQGDVVQQCTVQAPPYAEPVAAPFLQALERPVPIVALELARARHHLRRLADALDLAGLDALGRRLLRAAAGLVLGQRLRWLRPMLKGSGLLASVGAGRGVLSDTQASEIGGSAARAAGLSIDARMGDRGYAQLGFEPIVQPRGKEVAGDIRARWRQWLDEIDQSLRLAAHAADIDAHTAKIGVVEGPGGRLATDQPLPDTGPVLETLLPGCEWNQALAVIGSLPLAGTATPGAEAGA